MKYGNVKIDEIESVVKSMNQTKESSEKLTRRLIQNLSSFLPCDISQEIIIAFSSQEEFGNIIDFMHSINYRPDDMDYALLYPKYSYNIGYVAKRIKKIFTSDHMDIEKERYFREAFCNKKMMGRSANFYYKWYSAVIKFYEFIDDTESIGNVFDLYQEAFNNGLELAGNNLCELFWEMLVVCFELFWKDRDPSKVLKFYGLSKKYGLELNVYHLMIETDFSTPELNPEKYILDLWNSRSPNLLNPCVGISYKTGLSTREIMDFLISHNQIQADDIFTRWNKGENPMTIAYDMKLEVKDVQSFLKENLDKLSRKGEEDLNMLNEYYYNQDDDF